MTMTLVQTVTVGSGGAASIEFTNIPQTGKDLLVLFSLRSTTTGFNVFCRYNGDSSTNYFHRTINGFGDSVSSTFTSSDTQLFSGRIVPSSATSNTFSNQAMYVSNYTSSSNKSISIDSVSENNDISAYQTVQAGSYTTSSSITQILLYPSVSFAQYSTASLYIVTASGTAPTPGSTAKATGGTITSSNGFIYHTFTSSGTFTPNQTLTCDYLVVAGGGAGGNGINYQGGGGGGGGGFQAFYNTSFSATGYTVTVGAGGSGASGSNSSFNSITSTGGGKGGNNNTAGSSGGSGGGAGGNSSTIRSGGTGTAGQGNNGGRNARPTNIATESAGGGGGSSAVGGEPTTNDAAGDGADGLIWMDGIRYGGGGGGGGNDNSGGRGNGGGGNGGTFDRATVSGTANRGGGGGGGSSWTNNFTGAAGGSGVVIVRYAA